MNICAKCNRSMKVAKTGVSFVEMARMGMGYGSEQVPYKLWMADLWECPDCGAQFLHTDARQQPVAEHYQDDFAAKMASYAPQYKSFEQVRERSHRITGRGENVAGILGRNSPRRKASI